MNYYNEIDPFAAAWLRQLIADKQIPDGIVDERSITEVQPSDLDGFIQCHFFAGIAGWSLALRLAGVPDNFSCWTGSCPCQPFSSAGKQDGTADERHLWPVLGRLIRECRPPVVFGEQVASKLARTDWLPGVCMDLQAMGYSATAVDLCAPCAGEIGEGRVVRGDQESWEPVIIGHPHIRQRLYWVAESGDHRTRRISGEARGCGRKPVDAGAESLRQAHGETGTGGADSRSASGVERVADTHSREHHRSLPRAGERTVSGSHEESDASVGVADTGREGSQGHRQLGEQPVPPRWEGTERHSPARSGHVLIPCRDGKTRRIEPGIFPLVNGLPRGVVPSGDPGDPGYANATAEARAVRLKGYGNAIVPPLAALFIRSYLETL